jgi:hypothetical protein
MKPLINLGPVQQTMAPPSIVPGGRKILLAGRQTMQGGGILRPDHQ